MKIGNYFEITKKTLFLIAGPCVLEDSDTNSLIAESIQEYCEKIGIKYIFKASFDKANRTSVDSFRGYGIDEGLKELSRIKKEFGLPVITDIHESYQAHIVAEVADVLQIPAFLCRQTDLLLESGKTGKPINIKKAQFLSANDMQNVIHKVESTGNKNIMLCERGTMFGYNNLVVDFRNIYDMLQFGYPVVMDATHSTQRPGGSGYMSGGDPKYAPYLAKSSIIFGATGLFFEVHPNPPKALSDSKTMINLGEFYKVLVEMKKLHNFVINSL